MDDIIDIIKFYIKSAWEGAVSLINPIDWDYLIGSINSTELIIGGFILLVILVIWQASRFFKTPVVDASLENNPGRLARAAKEWVRRGEYLVAAGLYVKAKKFHEAADCYEKANAPLKAAEFYYRVNDFVRAANNFEKAKQYDRAASLYIKTQMFKNAAENFEHFGNLKSAAELYEKAGEFDKAGELYKRIELFQKSADMFKYTGHWVEACSVLEIMVNNALASHGVSAENNAYLRSLVRDSIDCFTKAGKIDRIAEILERCGLFKDAAELFRMNNSYKKAAELFARTGDFLDSAQCYERAGMFQDSSKMRARYHEERGEVLEAAKIYETLGDLNSAAEIYEKSGDLVRAAGLYFRAGDFNKAGALYEKEQDKVRAAESYEKAGELKKAAELYSLCGNREKEIELLERSGQNILLAKRYMEQGLTELAISTLQKVSQSSPEYTEAMMLLAKTFKEKGEISLAMSKYKEALEGKKVTEQNIEIFYELAELYEKNGNFTEATKIYEDILKVQYHYKDVVQRVRAVKEKIQVQGVRTAEKFEELYAETKYTIKEKPPSKKKYEILGEIGKGAMGIVYKARDTILQRIVALKVMPKFMVDSQEIVEKFLNEARSAAKLNHPNIVTVYEAGEEEGDFFIAMEYIEGSNIKQLLHQKKPFPVQGVLFIAAQICKGLGYAHENNIVHRDIKPTNIMWTPKKLVKILDFGLAKVIQEMASTVTIIGGTPHYMSPEQTLGEKVDHRTDIYSLGVTIFEMSTGKLPFSKGDIGYHHIHTPPPNPKDFNPSIPDELSHIILKCMAKRPEDRYSSAYEIFDELKKIKV